VLNSVHGNDNIYRCRIESNRIDNLYYRIIIMLWTASVVVQRDINQHHHSLHEVVVCLEGSASWCLHWARTRQQGTLSSGKGTKQRRTHRTDAYHRSPCWQISRATGLVRARYRKHLPHPWSHGHFRWGPVESTTGKFNYIPYCTWAANGR